MKKIKVPLKNIALATLIFSGFLACDKDFASLESDVVNSENTSNFDTDKVIYPVIAYNKKVAPFQSNRLPAYFIGYNNHPVYGNSTANLVAQMSPSTFSQTFGSNIVLDSVLLTIPYFSTVTSTDELGKNSYRLDSLYGNSNIKLSVYQNNYFLKNFNPDADFDEPQKYYSDGSTSETASISPIDLEGQLLYQNNNFLPSANPLILTELDAEGVNTDSTTVAPRLRVRLDTLSTLSPTYWQELIFNKEGEPELSNQNNFFDYFRGLYIKSEATDVDGSMILLNFTTSEANVTLYYTSDVDDPQNAGETIEQSGNYVLNFSGNKVGLFDNNFINIPDGDVVNGDEKLFLKGGEGSMAVVHLFNDNTNVDSPEFTQFKEDFIGNDTTKKRLVNEAYLEFFVDQTTVQGQEPNRIYLYDLKNNSPLIDYFIDQSVSGATVNAKINHLVPLVRVDEDSDGDGIKYKIRITEHINNIILRDSTNAKLGLVVTSDVSSIDLVDLLGDDESFKSFPTGAILSPRGTVLVGNNTTDENKKVKLTIYYTEPEN